MRWNKPIDGAVRVRSWFALFPVFANADQEWRWLEWVTVRYRYNDVTETWVPVRFVDEDKGAKE